MSTEVHTLTQMCCSPSKSNDFAYLYVHSRSSGHCTRCDWFRSFFHLEIKLVSVFAPRHCACERAMFETVVDDWYTRALALGGILNATLAVHEHFFPFATVRIRLSHLNQAHSAISGDGEPLMVAEPWYIHTSSITCFHHARSFRHTHGFSVHRDLDGIGDGGRGKRPCEQQASRPNGLHSSRECHPVRGGWDATHVQQVCDTSSSFVFVWNRCCMKEHNHQPTVRIECEYSEDGDGRRPSGVRCPSIGVQWGTANDDGGEGAMRADGMHGSTRKTKGNGCFGTRKDGKYATFNVGRKEAFGLLHTKTGIFWTEALTPCGRKSIAFLGEVYTIVGTCCESKVA